VEIFPNNNLVKKNGVVATLVDISGISVGVAIFTIGIFVTYDVIARTVFRLTNSWVTEVTMYLMGYITFVGAAYALKMGAHVAVDVFVQKVSIEVKRVLLLAVDFVFLVTTTELIWLSFQFFFDAWNSNEISDTLLAVSLWIPYLSFFVGMVLLLVVIVMQTLAHLHQQTDKKRRASYD
jgi:TRAP-type C4-dicarboxylate transport system permease small subunit